MKRRALYVNGGGSLIQDVTSRRSLWYFLYTLRAAKARGCRVMMYGCGIGPVTRERGVRSTKKTLNSSVDVITLREPDSVEELGRFGVTEPEIVLAADPALTLRAAPRAEVEKSLAAAGLPEGTRCAGFALRHWQGFSEKAPAIAACARYLYEKHGLTPVFIPINHKSDIDAGREAAAQLEGVPYVLLPGTLPSGLAIGVLGRDGDCRLHAPARAHLRRGAGDAGRGHKLRPRRSPPSSSAWTASACRSRRSRPRGSTPSPSAPSPRGATRRPCAAAWRRCAPSNTATWPAPPACWARRCERCCVTAAVVSGDCPELQALLASAFFGEIDGFELAAVVVTGPDSAAAARCGQQNIPVFPVDYGIFPNDEVYTRALTAKLQDLDAEAVLLVALEHEPLQTLYRAYSGRCVCLRRSERAGQLEPRPCSPTPTAARPDASAASASRRRRPARSARSHRAAASCSWRR